MKVVAKSRYLKVSAQKLRLSADVVRGQRALDARNSLRAMNQKTAGFVAEALAIVTANAENNHNLNANTMTISEIRVDEGPKLKRARPRSKGMSAPILHPMSHLTIVLDDTVVEAKSKTKKKPAKVVAKTTRITSATKPTAKEPK